MSLAVELFLLNINHERIKAMRKIVKTRWVLLFIVLLCGLGVRAQSWETIGAPGISSGDVSFTSIAVENGTPYVAYRDGANNYKATVKKFNGVNWVTVGQAGFTSPNIGVPSLAVYNGTPYVAYQGNFFDDGQKAMVKKFDGTSWVDVGSTAASSGNASMVTVAIDNGTIYVAFEDYSNSQKATVKKLNGNIWEDVGLPVSTGVGDYPIIAINNGIPYIAFSDESNGGKAVVKKFNGTTWETVGNSGFSAGDLYWCSLAFDNTTPYLAYVDAANGNKATVMKFNGIVWENVGPSGFSTNLATYPDLVINNGIPSISYIDAIDDPFNTVFTLVVKQFNGTIWEDVGSTPVTTDNADYSSLTTANGVLYVSYKDDGSNYKLTVKKFGTPVVPMKLKFITSSDGRSIKLPLYGSVNCTVDWGDGSSPENYTTVGLKSHTFTTAGTYIVSISGSLTRFGYYDIGNASGWRGSGYLTEVIDFGDIGLTSLAGAFSDADNLSVVPTTLPSSITDLSYCFYLNSRVSITNLNSWDLSHVTNMLGAFYEASAFNQDISGWDVSNVISMENLFKRAYAFNQPIGTWDVGNVITMEDMFRNATAFNQPIGSWDVSSVTTMEGMFESNSVFNQDIGNWNVAGVTTMASMFDWATAFNQDISSWDVGSVTDMSWMFSGATAFNQNLANWDITSVTTMEDMFANVTLSTANYDAILTAWASQTVQQNVLFGAGNSKYSAGTAASARASLINNDNWTITDGGMNIITYTWNGSVSSDWNTAANWDLNTVPGATDDVVITNTGTAPMLSASAQVSCNALTVNSGASLTISSGGSLIANSSTGTVIVKRTLSGTNQYHFISSPVNNADLSTVFEVSLQDKIYLRRYDEPSGNWMNITIPATLSNGIGYSFFRSATKAIGTSATFTGTLITSDLTPSISNNGPAGNDQYKGYNLIGNPYTSAIKWGQGNWNRSNVDDAVYVWSNGVYKSYVGGVGALTNGVIPAQQGFFVKANGASPSITIPAAARVHNTQAFYKNSIFNTLRLEVASSVNDYVDATFIRFAPEATALFDNQLDAYKLENDAEAPMIYTTAGEDLLSVNSLPSSNQYSELVVSFTAGVNGRYNITASGMESFGNSNIVLMDMLTNATQNLALNPIYAFDATTQDASDRFKVSFASVGIDNNPLQNIGIYSSDGKIMLQLPEVTKAEVIITSIAGQVVASHFINAVGLIELPVSVSSGIYVVSVKGQAGIVTRKVFVR